MHNTDRVTLNATDRNKKNKQTKKKTEITLVYIKPLLQIHLFVAGACIVVYSNRTLSLDGRGNFFRGVTIFCWVMVIMYHITYMFGLNKSKNCFGQPSNFTIIVSRQVLRKSEGILTKYFYPFLLPVPCLYDAITNKAY